MTTDTVGWADVNGVALRYKLGGEGPALVMLHEMGGTLESWDDVCPLLRGRQLLRYDFRGSGLSQKLTGTPQLDDLVADLVALLDAVGLPGPVAIAGIAVGAAIGLRFAARYPARAVALVAMSPATGLADHRRRAAIELAERIEREGMRERILERIDQSFPRVYRTDARRFEGFRGRVLGNDPRSYAAIYRMLAKMDLSADLPRIACPVLLLAGHTDQTRPPDQVRALAEAIPRATFVEVASGHVMPMLTPDLVAAQVDTFLTKNGMPARPDSDIISTVGPAKLV